MLDGDQLFASHQHQVYPQISKEKGEHQTTMFKLLALYLALSLALASLAPTAIAQKAKHHRYQYPTDGPVPEGLVLRMLGKVASQRPEFITPILTMEAGISESEAQELTMYLAELSSEHLAERRASEIRVVCENAPFVSTDSEAYKLFDLADDVRFIVDSKFYNIANADLTPKQFRALRFLMNYVKDGISVNVVDHQAFYEGGPDGAAMNDLAQFCADRGR